MKPFAPVLLTALALGFATPAFADGKVQCHGGPKSGWKPVSALTAKLTAEGWKIKKAKPERDCYEVYATTKEGKVEAFFHPVTFEKVLVLQRGKVLYKAPAHMGH
jgi:hypothetical protein